MVNVTTTRITTIRDNRLGKGRLSLSSFGIAQLNKLGMAAAGQVRFDSIRKTIRVTQQFTSAKTKLIILRRTKDLRVKVGDAFDIVAERKQTDYKVIARNVYEYAYEIKIRNHKDGPVNVVVNEPIGGDWEMISATFEAKRPRPSPLNSMYPWQGRRSYAVLPRYACVISVRKQSSVAQFVAQAIQLAPLFVDIAQSVS